MSSPDTPSADWPWSELGIGPTGDPEAIKAAYEDRRSRIDPSAPISTHTRLSEARAKALFLAAQAKREGAAPAGPSFPQSDEDDRPVTVSDSATPAISPEEQANIADGRSTTSSRPNRLVVEIVPRADRLAAQDPAIRRKQTGLWIGAGVVCAIILVAMVGLVAQRVSREFEQPAYDDAVVVQDGRFRDPPQVAMANEILPRLFGEGYRLEQLRQDNPGLAYELMGAMQATYGETGEDNARAQLRVSIVESRHMLDRTQLLDASRLYLAWLRAAKAEGGGACSEVTRHSFFYGIPHLEGDTREREQRFARSWAASGARPDPDAYAQADRPDIPAWLMAETVASTGLGKDDVAAAVDSLVDPRRCEVSIALFEAMLARPADAPRSLMLAL